ncbi:MAG: hypothetical protein U0359_12815 [Byssovorax sp.]
MPAMAPHCLACSGETAETTCPITWIGRRNPLRKRRIVICVPSASRLWLRTKRPPREMFSTGRPAITPDAVWR